MRLPYTPVTPTTTDPEERAIIERIQLRRAPRPLQPLDRALLHAPAVADGWNSFLGAVRTKTSLPDGARELAICRVAIVNRAWYEWGHHAPLATKGGVSDAGLELVKRDDLSSVTPEEVSAAGLDAKEWASLVYADEMTKKVEVADETFALVKAAYNDKEVVELTTTVAAYNCVSRFLVALNVGERNGTGPDAAH